MNNTVALIIALLIAALSIVYFSVLPTMAGKADREFCVSLMETPVSVSQQARSLHSTLLVADLHSDNLLWDRDFLERLDHGHLDLPRMQEGNMAVQVFDAVIKVPRELNYEANQGDTDQITKLAIANRWPVATWFNLTNRALHQAELLHDAANRSNGQLYVITSAPELRSFLEIRRSSKRRVVGGLLSVEGLHSLEGVFENVDRLYAAGYRILGLTHFFDNEVGGSSGGVEKGGITEFGKSVISRMDELSLTIDLAHASSALIDDVLVLTNRPVIVTHTGVKGILDSPRNLSDNQIRGIANTGGVIGIGFWEGALGEDITPAAIARSIKYVRDLVGVEHVGLGSDFDGATTTMVDASGMALITQALVDERFTDEEIRAVMGGNVVRVLSQTLPQR